MEALAVAGLEKHTSMCTLLPRLLLLLPVAVVPL